MVGFRVFFGGFCVLNKWRFHPSRYIETGLSGTSHLWHMSYTNTPIRLFAHTNRVCPTVYISAWLNVIRVTATPRRGAGTLCPGATTSSPWWGSGGGGASWLCLYSVPVCVMHRGQRRWCKLTTPGFESTQYTPASFSQSLIQCEKRTLLTTVCLCLAT